MSPGMSLGMNVLEKIILTVFCVEFAIRLGADEFHIHEFVKRSIKDLFVLIWVMS